jgi:superfamily II DNA helicase RecQ
MNHNLSNRISNPQYHEQLTSKLNPGPIVINSIITEFFGFEEYRKKQQESICSFLSGQNTLTILKTGGVRV